MSVQSPQHDQTLECGYCDEQFTPPATAGSFCSPECHHAHRGMKSAREVFEILEQDHRYCGTCGRRLKDIQKPPKQNSVGKEIPDFVIGWQFRTDYATIGERSPSVDVPDEEDLDIPKNPADPDGPVYAYEKDGTDKNVGNFRDYHNTPDPEPSPSDPVLGGTVCNCGNTDHRHEEESIRNRLPFTTAYYIGIASQDLRSEGKHDVEIDRDRLVDAVLEQVLPTENENGVVEPYDIDLLDAFAKAVVL